MREGRLTHESEHGDGVLVDLVDKVLDDLDHPGVRDLAALRRLVRVLVHVEADAIERLRDGVGVVQRVLEAAFPVVVLDPHHEGLALDRGAGRSPADRHRALVAIVARAHLDAAERQLKRIWLRLRRGHGSVSVPVLPARELAP